MRLIIFNVYALIVVCTKFIIKFLQTTKNAMFREELNLCVDFWVRLLCFYGSYGKVLIDEKYFIWHWFTHTGNTRIFVISNHHFLKEFFLKNCGLFHKSIYKSYKTKKFAQNAVLKDQWMTINAHLKFESQKLVYLMQNRRISHMRIILCPRKCKRSFFLKVLLLWIEDDEKQAIPSIPSSSPQWVMVC